MSNTSKVVISIVVLLLVGWIVMRGLGKTATPANIVPIQSSTQTSDNSDTQIQSSTTTQDGSVSTASSDTSDSAIDQDTANIDSQLNTLDSDSANVDAHTGSSAQ